MEPPDMPAEFERWLNAQLEEAKAYGETEDIAFLQSHIAIAWLSHAWHMASVLERTYAEKQQVAAIWVDPEPIVSPV